MTITQPQNNTTSLSITPEIINVTLPSHPPSQVTWTSETIDNEFLNRKSSKRCCIFKKKREWDESSSESESDGGKKQSHPRKVGSSLSTPRRTRRNLRQSSFSFTLLPILTKHAP